MMRVGSRRSGIAAASRSAMPIRRAAAASSITPPSEESLPPSNAAVIFRPTTAGKVKERLVSLIMAGVACGDGADRIRGRYQIMRGII
jgi:hypothetical protein